YDLLKAKNDPRGVINAAIPAYTLHQTLSRYEYELHGRVKVDAVYLQIYNPVNQLLLRGPNWKPTDNWATIDIVGHDDKPYWLSQYSAISAIADKAAYQYLSPETAKRFFRPPSPYLEILSPSDTATLDMFRKQVRGEFEQLLQMALEDGARRFIVAPITVRKTSRAEFSAARRVAVDTLNDEMHKFAEAHPGQVVYLDTIALLDKLPEKEAFIDDCCHLAEPGNQAVAAQLVELLK